jgi:hypothetical protein
MGTGFSFTGWTNIVFETAFRVMGGAKFRGDVKFIKKIRASGSLLLGKIKIVSIRIDSGVSRKIRMQ